MCKKSLRLMVICFVALFAFSSFALAVDQSQTNRQSLLQQLINFFLKNGRAEVAGTISINGVCGSANGQIFSSTPTTNLCAAGTTSIISGTGPWLWICAGQNGGTTTSCSANKIDIPSIRVISPNGGEQLKIGDTISVSWSISGYESLWDSNLQFVQLQLWNDSGTQFIGSFCTACNSSSAGGNYSWTIGKVFGSSQVDVQPGQYRIRASVVSNTVLSNYALDFSDASFTISQPINGACGSASGHNYLGSDTGWGNYTQCSSGSVSATTFPGPNTIQYWSCYGINGGTTENCSAYRASNTLVNGTCGSANGTTVSSVPTTNLCNAGTVGNILRNALGQWMWQCAGLNGGTTASCLANVKTNTCAVVDGFAMTDLVSNNLPDTIEFWAQATCPNSGSVYDYPIPDGYTLVSCTTDSTLGSHCGCSNCIMSKVKLQKKSTNIINGTCGSANSTTVSSIPTTNLCSTGIASGISGSGPWTWTCVGQYGGTTASCSAKKITSTCSTLWWIDSNNKTCQSKKQFCGAYMYQSLETFNSQQECLNKANLKTDINFKEKNVAICKENSKPIIYYFGSTTCPHCQWETPVIDGVVNSFGDYVSYHKNIDNSLDQNIFEQYSPGGSIPVIVAGCKYYRIGSGESFGEEAEKAGLKKLICSLTGNQPASVCGGYTCSEVYNPVCGSDGKTYSNSCKATNAGASVSYSGACGQTTINTSAGTITISKPLNQMNRQELINFLMILIEALSKKQ